MLLQPSCQELCELRLRSNGNCRVNEFQGRPRNADQGGGFHCRGTCTEFSCRCQEALRCGTLEPNRDGLP